MPMDWVESGGGPLLAAPASQLARWEGATDDEGPEETWGDYGRACAIDGYIGLVGIGGGQGLVLGDEPATTTYLPDERLFVRWAAADSESDLVDAARHAVHGVEWQEELDWTSTAPSCSSTPPGPARPPNPATT